MGSESKEKKYLIELLDGALSIEAEMDRIERRVDFSAIGPLTGERLDGLQSSLDLQFAIINREAAKLGFDGLYLIDLRKQGRKPLWEALGL